MVGRLGARVNRFTAHRFTAPSLQFRVLGFGLFQDPDVGIGVFPTTKEF
jgi:hypothetical protein